jgi:hypothetical protein
VGPKDPPGTSSFINLSGARGETVDTQIVVTAPAGNSLTNVNVTLTNLTGPNGAVIPSSNYTLYREWYVSFAAGSIDYGPGATNRPLPPGTYADPLIPFNDPETGAPLSGNSAAIHAAPFSVTAGQNQVLWVDLSIPRGAANTPAQTYTGTITITSAQGNVNVPVDLTVWNFELPLMPSEKTLFGGNSRFPHDRAFQKAMMRNKIVPWLTEPADSASNVSNFGMNRTALEFYGSASCSSMSPPPSVATLQSAMAANSSTVPQFDLYPVDELDGCSAIYPTLQQWARNAHAAGASIMAVLTPQLNTPLYSDGTASGKPAVDFWATLPRNWPAAPSTTPPAPAKIWSYNDCEGDSYSPKWEIDFLPVNFRIQAGFLNQTQGASGLLYSAVDLWPNSDPWINGVTANVCGWPTFPGEGFLLYPAGDIGSSEPAASMRLKYLRDGIQDYEYVQILKNIGQGSNALSIIQPIATDWRNWTKNTTALEGARMRLGQTLNGLAP